jgi:hypothetical protein
LAGVQLKEQALTIPVPFVRVQLVGMPGGRVPENVTVPEGLVSYSMLLFATTTAQTSGTPTVPVNGKQAKTIVVGV